MTDKGHQSDSLQGTTSPPPCANGCGFFGSQSTMNMCSKCFRDTIKTKPTNPSTASPSTSSPDVSATASCPSSASTPIVAQSPLPPLPLPQPPAAPLVAVAVPPHSPSSAIAAQVQADAKPPRKVQKSSNRCFSCRKKVGLTGFKCHCGYIYCSDHRYSEAHDCDYDYQTSGREQLAKANPVVVASKLDKI